MNPAIIEKIKRFQWVNAWSGNWPLLDGMVSRGEEYEKESVRVCGVSLRLIEINMTEDGISTFYRASVGYERIDRELLARFEEAPDFIKKSAIEYTAKINADIRGLQQIYKIKNLRELSNQEILELFEKARRHFDYNGMIDTYDWYIEKLFTPVLEKILTEKLGKLGKADLVSEYISTLVAPHKVSMIFKERQQLFAIIKYVRANQSLEKIIKSGATCSEVCNRDKQFARLLKAYFKKFVWMPVLVNNPPHTLETVFMEIADAVITGAPLVINTKRLGDNHDLAAIKKSFEYLSELKLNRKDKLLVLGLRAMAFLRTEDYWSMSKMSYLVIPLYTEVAGRLGLTYAELKQFLPEEIKTPLRAGGKISVSEARDRARLSGYVTLEKEEYLVTGEEIEEIKKFLDGQLRTKKNSGEDSWLGVVGNSGKVQGVARVALNPAEASNIKNGEILVVASVSAAFVSFLRKAIGIVSEFGGLTSHPVIVAREFDLPCLVGVKEITKHLSDGDLIEVDANKGLVSVIKRKK